MGFDTKVNNDVALSRYLKNHLEFVDRQRVAIWGAVSTSTCRVTRNVVVNYFSVVKVTIVVSNCCRDGRSDNDTHDI